MELFKRIEETVVILRKCLWLSAKYATYGVPEKDRAANVPGQTAEDNRLLVAA